MSDDESSQRPAKEPEWMTKLASLGATAAAKQQRERKLRGSSGAASEGKSLQAWACACGWIGTVKELKPDPKTWALTCPSCGQSKGLAAQAG